MVKFKPRLLGATTILKEHIDVFNLPNGDLACSGVCKPGQSLLDSFMEASYAIQDWTLKNKDNIMLGDPKTMKLELAKQETHEEDCLTAEEHKAMDQFNKDYDELRNAYVKLIDLEIGKGDMVRAGKINDLFMDMMEDFK